VGVSLSCKDMIARVVLTCVDVASACVAGGVAVSVGTVTISFCSSFSDILSGSAVDSSGSF